MWSSAHFRLLCIDTVIIFIDKLQILKNMKQIQAVERLTRAVDRRR